MFDKLFTPYRINSMTLPNRLVLPAMVLLFCCLFFPKSGFAFSHSKPIDKHYVLTEARKKYYNLRNHGLKDFRAQADVNWQLMIDSMNISDSINTPLEKAVAPYALSKLAKEYKAIHFDVLLDSENNVSVTHHLDHPFTDTSTIRQVNRTTKATEKNISSFFSAWSQYLFDSPFLITDSTYDVIDSADDYWISHQADDAYIRMRMSKDFIIREKFIFYPTYHAHIVTDFQLSSEGLLLTTFDATADILSNGSISNHAHLTYKCDYSNVDGFQLPHTVTARTDNAPSVEWTFSNYSLKRID